MNPLGQRGHINPITVFSLQKDSSVGGDISTIGGDTTLQYLH